MYVQRRLDTYITLCNVSPIIDDVNTIIADAAISPPLKLLLLTQQLILR